MERILADGKGVFREAVTDVQFRAAFLEAIPEIAAELPEEGIHILVAALGQATLAHLRSGNVAVPLRVADLLHSFLSGSQPTGEIANALQISFPSSSELRAEPGAASGSRR